MDTPEGPPDASLQALVIVIRIEPGDPIAGTLRAEGEASDRRFAGWVELMAQITAARRRGGHRG